MTQSCPAASYPVIGFFGNCSALMLDILDSLYSWLLITTFRHSSGLLQIDNIVWLKRWLLHIGCVCCVLNGIKNNRHGEVILLGC